jgi:hypothetical protein
MELMEYLSEYSLESAQDVWNKFFVDYGFLNLGNEKFT